MAVSPWKFAGSVASVDRNGRAAWTSPANAAIADDLRAVCDVAKSSHGDWLEVTGFGLGTGDVPPGATIDGIEVEIERQAESSDISDSALYLMVGGGQAGSNKASASDWSSTDAAAAYGGAGDLWGAAIGDADVRSSGFGVRLSAANSSFFAARQARVDAIRLRVHYTATDPNAQVPVTGPAALCETGTVSAGAAVDVEPGDAAAAGLVGASIVELVVAVDLTGVVALPAAATPMIRFDGSFAVMGVEASAPPGAASVAADQEAAPLGASASGVTGSAATAVSPMVSAGGALAAAGLGQVAGEVAAEAMVAGAAMAGHLATTIIRIDADVAITGFTLPAACRSPAVRRFGWIDEAAAVGGWLPASGGIAAWQAGAVPPAAWSAAAAGAEAWSERVPLPGGWIS